MTAQSEARDLLRRLLAFGSLPLLSSIAPLLLLPVLARVTGAAGWTGLVVAQALGAFSAVVILFGWGVSGQARAALTRSHEERVALYAESLVSRFLLAAAVLPVGIVVLVLGTAPADLATSVTMYVATACSGFSTAWFCIGLGRASWIARYEAVPRLVATAASLPVVVLLHTVWPYPVLLIVASIAGLAAFQRRELGGGLLLPSLRRMGAGWRSVGRDWRAALVAVAANAYAAAPVPIAALLFAETAVAGTASMDKLYRYGLFAVSATGNAMQSWVLGGAAVRSGRQRVAVALHLTLGLGGLAVLGLAGPQLTALAFGERVGASGAVALWYAVAFLAVSTATPLVSTVLVPAGRISAVAAATVAGAVLGVPAMAVLGHLFGVYGVSAGFAGSELLSLLLLVPPSLRLLRRGSDSPVPVDEATRPLTGAVRD